ncbi:hypothetical protein T08_15506 [Trichinella sp. T8]|nr:hypothetical protein T08_15506 [Trichinella sp. T8]
MSKGTLKSKEFLTSSFEQFLQNMRTITIVHKAYIAKPAYLSVCQLQKCTVGCKTWNTGNNKDIQTWQPTREKLEPKYYETLTLLSSLEINLNKKHRIIYFTMLYIKFEKHCSEFIQLSFNVLYNADITDRLKV